MILYSRAQNFEDVLLWRALHNISAGKYLDIGAQDPAKDSVSLLFYESGWRGMHVEPTPTYAARLRAARPDETVIEAAVSTAPGPLEFYEIPNTGLSTGKDDIAKTHSEKGYEPRKILVPTVRLDALLNEIGEVHWMKIDVEGMEADVLESWGECPHRPWIVVVEATVPNSQIRTDGLWRNQLLERGYRDAHFDGLSRYYVHEAHADLAEILEASPNIFDLFQVTEEHFSTAALVRDNTEAVRKVLERLSTAEHDALSLREQLEMSREALQVEAASRGEVEHAKAQLSEAHLRLETAFADSQTRSLERDEQLNNALSEALRNAAEIALEHSQSLDKLWHEFHLREETSRKVSMKLERQLRNQVLVAREALASALAEREKADLRSANQESILRNFIQNSNDEIAALKELNAEQQRAGEIMGALCAELKQSRDQARIENEAKTRSLEAAEEELRSAHAETKLANGRSEELSNRLVGTETTLSACKSLVDEQSRDREAMLQNITELNRKLSDSREIIGDAVAISNGWWQSLGRALGIVRDPRLSEQFDAWTSVINWSGVTMGDTVPLMTSMERPNPYLRADSLRKLLAYDDVNFVRCAYVTILGRQPDADGEDYYVRRIRDGYPKLLILRQLRKSPEAREHDPGIAGLDRELSRFWRARLPVVGPLLSSAYSDAWSPQGRRFRRLENIIFRVNDAQQRRFDRVETALSAVRSQPAVVRPPEVEQVSIVTAPRHNVSLAAKGADLALTRQIASQFSPSTIRGLRKKISQ